MTPTQKQALEAAQKCISELRDEIAKISGSSLLAGERCKSEDKVILYKIACGCLGLTSIVESQVEAVLAEPEQEPVLGGRESVDAALEIIESWGSGTNGLNDTYARQVLLAQEIRRLQALYQMAVAGRADMRTALKNSIASTSPQPREWQELSESAVLTIGAMHSQESGNTRSFSEDQYKACVKAISAALRAKNGGA